MVPIRLLFYHEKIRRQKSVVDKMKKPTSPKTGGVNAVSALPAETDIGINAGRRFVGERRRFRSDNDAG